VKKLLTALLIAVSLSGCANLKALDTRVTCTLAKDEARADSKWGFFGLSTTIAEADTKVICKP
jgi:hypothetical protein